MPVFGQSTIPFPTLNSVMNTARARVGDMLDSVDGTLLTNDAEYAQTYVDAAWMWYQDKCSNAGIELQIREAVLTGMPARFTDDPANQSFVNWNGCGDGVNEYQQPAIPEELATPLSVWRRQSGTVAAFQLMTQAAGGLPVYFDTNVYDWRSNSLYFFGERYAQDLRIRYSQYFPKLDLQIPGLVVPMVGCQDCLGARIAFEHASARGGAGATALAAWAEEAFKETAQRTSRRKQRQSIRRIGYAGSGVSGSRWPVVR